jgi:hypothetical protein
LIREKKEFEEFSPNDVLERILTHELMDMEIQQRRKFGELEAKMNNLKIKDVALQAYKSSKPSTSSKPSKSKSKKVEVESSTSGSSEDVDEGPHIEIGDMDLFLKTYKRGLKSKATSSPREGSPTRKRELATIVEAQSTLLRIALMRRKRASMIRTTRIKCTTRKIKRYITRGRRTMVEKPILVMNGTPVMKTLVMERIRKLQPLPSKSYSQT